MSNGELDAAFGPPELHGGWKNWFMDLEESSTQPLDGQLARAEAFLRSHRELLAARPSTIELVLFISWTPRISQDSVAFPRPLVRLLGELGADLLIDTHLDL